MKLQIQIKGSKTWDPGEPVTVTDAMEGLNALDAMLEAPAAEGGRPLRARIRIDGGTTEVVGDVLGLYVLAESAQDDE